MADDKRFDDLDTGTQQVVATYTAVQAVRDHQAELRQISNGTAICAKCDMPADGLCIPPVVDGGDLPIDTKDIPVFFTCKLHASEYPELSIKIMRPDS